MMVFNWSGFARVYSQNGTSAAEACNIKDLPPGVFVVRCYYLEAVWRAARQIARVLIW
jgi:hypothetical protein